MKSSLKKKQFTCQSVTPGGRLSWTSSITYVKNVSKTVFILPCYAFHIILLCCIAFLKNAGWKLLHWFCKPPCFLSISKALYYSHSLTFFHPFPQSFSVLKHQFFFPSSLTLYTTSSVHLCVYSFTTLAVEVNFPRLCLETRFWCFRWGLLMEMLHLITTDKMACFRTGIQMTQYFWISWKRKKHRWAYRLIKELG